jgi:hypothetical protein
MESQRLVEILLEHAEARARDVLEASIHPPNRGKIWKASFRDAAGRQRRLSTGTSDRPAHRAPRHRTMKTHWINLPHMNAEALVDCVLDSNQPFSSRELIELLEASVHLPARGTIYMAAYRDEFGQPVQRSTRTRDRLAAQAIADEWEAAAKRKRAALGPQPKKPTVRVRRGGPEHQAGLRTQAEVAATMHIGERAVRALERSAFLKLRNHPQLRELWREWLGIDEGTNPASGAWDLTPSEIRALLDLAADRFERQALKKLIALTGN